MLDWLNDPPPAIEKFAPDAIVSAPVWLIATGPAVPTSKFTVLLKVILVPVILMPAKAVVLRAPKELVPEPALCTIDAAEIAPVVMLLPDVKVTILRG